VGDVPNHIVNAYEAHTTFPNNAPLINGLKVAETWSRGIGDLTDGNGTVTSYLVYVMENGDRFFVRAANVTQIGAAGMLTGTVVGHITGGRESSQESKELYDKSLASILKSAAAIARPTSSTRLVMTWRKAVICIAVCIAPLVS
jgi:hypothetical protein